MFYKKKSYKVGERSNKGVCFWAVPAAVVRAAFPKPDRDVHSCAVLSDGFGLPSSPARTSTVRVCGRSIGYLVYRSQNKWHGREGIDWYQHHN